MPSRNQTLRRNFVNRYTRTGTENRFDNVTDYTGCVFSETTRSWENTANFRALKKAGSYLPPRPLHFSKMEYHGSAMCEITQVISQREGRYFVDTAQGPVRRNLPTLDHTSIIGDSELYSKVRERMRAQRWNAPVAFIEARKTDAMIAHRVGSLIIAVRQLRRGRLGDAYRTLGLTVPSNRVITRFKGAYGQNARKAAADAWLELQYGWVPFLSDVKSAAELLAHVVNKPQNRSSTISVKIYREKSSTIVDSVPFDLQCNYDRVARFQESKRLLGHYVVTGEIQNTASLLSLTNPLEVAWELVPFSFVVDWFLPIGDYLSNMSAFHGIDFKNYSIGHKVRIDEIYTNFRGPASSASVSSKASGSGGVTSIRVQRTVFTGAPPNPFPRIAGFGSGFTRTANALALLTQQLDRISRRV